MELYGCKKCGLVFYDFIKLSNHFNKAHVGKDDWGFRNIDVEYIKIESSSFLEHKIDHYTAVVEELSRRIMS